MSNLELLLSKLAPGSLAATLVAAFGEKSEEEGGRAAAEVMKAVKAANLEASANAAAAED